MSARLIAPIPYSTLTRFYDSWWIGRRDADPGLAHAPQPGEQPSASLRVLDATLHERCERERMNVVRIAASLIDRRSTLVLADVALRRQIEECTEQIDAQGAVEASELARVPKTEAHLDPAQRAERRRREAAGRIASLVAQRASARRERVEIGRELADIEGCLRTLYESLQSRIAALAHHYERRCNTIVRGYLRRSPGDAQHPLNARSPLRAPEWATSANPWLIAPDTKETTQ